MQSKLIALSWPLIVNIYKRYICGSKQYDNDNPVTWNQSRVKENKWRSTHSPCGRLSLAFSPPLTCLLCYFLLFLRWIWRQGKWNESLSRHCVRGGLCAYACVCLHGCVTVSGQIDCYVETRWEQPISAALRVWVRIPKRELREKGKPVPNLFSKNLLKHNKCVTLWTCNFFPLLFYC